MRITSIVIDNILATRHVEFKPGSLTIVKGKNSSGKTSILDAVRQIFEGGHDNGLLRRGAKTGECILGIDTGHTVKMRVTAKGTTYDVIAPDGNSLPAPRKFIEDLAKSLATDPAGLLTSKPKDLSAKLLEVMPVQFSQAELQAAVVEETWTVNTDMDLVGVERMEKTIYEARTQSNKDAKKASVTVEQLKKSLPEGDTQDWSKRLTELEALVGEGHGGYRDELATIQRATEEEIEELRKKFESDKDFVIAAYSKRKAEVDQQWQGDIRKIEAARDEAKFRKEATDKAEGLRLTIADNERLASESGRIADTMTRALENLAELKRAKLSNLPIPGLTVKDDMAFYNDVAFEHVNLAKRIELCIQICALLGDGSKLPFMILDEAENMDSETWEMFKQAAVASGFQVLAARVSDGPLDIETVAA